MLHDSSALMPMTSRRSVPLSDGFFPLWASKAGAPERFGSESAALSVCLVAPVNTHSLPNIANNNAIWVLFA
jgi:hypothetical protein